jgi:hypothetical protein
MCHAVQRRSPIAHGLLQLGVPCAMVLLAALALTWTWRDTLADQASEQRDIDRNLLARIDGWRPSTGSGVIVLGDSLGICHDARRSGKERVAAQLGESLAARGARTDVLDLVHPGLQPMDFLVLLNEASARRPLLAVVSVNLRFFRASAEVAAARLPQLARKLSLRQAWAVRDDLRSGGVSLLDVLLMRWKERLGLLYAVEGLREWGSARLDDASLALSRRLGIAVPDRARAAPPTEGHDSAYRTDFASHPQAATLRALRRDMEAAGVPVLFYVAPVSPKRLAEARIDPAEFAHRVQALRGAVGAEPDQWLDLHDAVPTKLFRDRRNHLLAAGCAVVSGALTERALTLLSSPSSPEPPDPRATL